MVGEERGPDLVTEQAQRWVNSHITRNRGFTKFACKHPCDKRRWVFAQSPGALVSAVERAIYDYHAHKLRERILRDDNPKVDFVSAGASGRGASHGIRTVYRNRYSTP